MSVSLVVGAQLQMYFRNWAHTVAHEQRSARACSIPPTAAQYPGGVVVRGSTDPANARGPASAGRLDYPDYLMC